MNEHINNLTKTAKEFIDKPKSDRIQKRINRLSK